MSLPNTSAAVLAQRRGKDDNEGLTDQEKLWKTLDFFATPPWAARAGIHHARRLWPDATVLREPAAGQGHIAVPAREYFPEVIGSDVHDHGRGFEVRDWLDDAAWPEEPDCDVVATNPPFAIAEQFVLKGLRRARLGVALLVRLSFVESASRFTILGGPTAKLTQLAIFSERASMVLGCWDPEASRPTAYAWLYWSKVHEPMAPRWFEPGTQAHYSRPTDPRDFGRREALPLFPNDPGDVI